MRRSKPSPKLNGPSGTRCSMVCCRAADGVTVHCSYSGADGCVRRTRHTGQVAELAIFSQSAHCTDHS